MKKRILFCLIGAALLFAAMSCSSNSDLKEVVEEVNNECPKPIDGVGDIVGAEIVDGNVVVIIETYEKFIESIQNNPDVMKTDVKESFRNPTEDIEALIDVLKKAKAGITYRYVGKDSGKEFEVSLTADEIVAIDKEEEDPQALLESLVAVNKLYLPMVVDDVTTMVDFIIEDGCVVYIYEVDESSFDFADFKYYKEDFDANITKSLREQKDDASAKGFLNACRKANADIKYRYFGTKGGKWEVTVPIAEVFASEKHFYSIPLLPSR